MYDTLTFEKVKNSRGGRKVPVAEKVCQACPGIFFRFVFVRSQDNTMLSSQGFVILFSLTSTLPPSPYPWHGSWCIFLLYLNKGNSEWMKDSKMIQKFHFFILNFSKNWVSRPTRNKPLSTVALSVVRKRVVELTTRQIYPWGAVGQNALQAFFIRNISMRNTGLQYSES